MIKRLIAAATFCLVSASAMAAMNIRQDGDGTANWQGAKTGTFDNCVGGTNLTFRDVRLDQANTTYLPVNVTGAIIKGAWGVSGGTSAGTSHVKIYVNQTTHALEFLNAAGTLATDAQLTFSTAVAGDTARISTMGEVSGATRLASNTTIEGGYIAVASDGGGSTSDASASIIVRVCPR